jgi:hypothetical protein
MLNPVHPVKLLFLGSIEAESVLATAVSVSDDSLVVELTDGRTLSVPLAWYPRLQHGTPEERRRFRLIGRGDGIQWPDLDEDISVTGLIAGRPSGESQSSLDRWLKSRK